MGVLGLEPAPLGPVQGLCSSRHKLLYIFTFSIFFFYIEWNFHANALQWNFRAGMREVRCIPRYGNKQCTKWNLTIPTPHLFPHLGTGGGCRSFWCFVLLARVCPPPPLSILRRPRPISWSALVLHNAAIVVEINTLSKGQLADAAQPYFFTKSMQKDIHPR